MILYIIQVIIYTAIMLAIYRLFLYNNNAHRFNRYYLLSSALLPVILPALKIPEFFSAAETNVMLYRLPEFNVTDTKVENTFQTATIIMMGIYVAGLIIAGLVFLLRYIRLKKLINSSEQENREGYVLVKNSGYGPASWNRYILLPEENTDETIIYHERAHIRMYHTIDIIIISLMQIVFWPNVFLWYIRKELIMVHEFQADEVAENYAKDYPQLLLASVFGKCTLPYTHSFITHPIKRRIIMLQRVKKYAGLRSVLAAACLLLATGVIISVQSCESKSWNVEKTGPAVEAENLTKQPQPKESIYEFMIENIIYPAEAKEKGIEGKVVVGFTIGTNGIVRDAMVVNKDEVDPLLQKAAMDAIAKIPDWEPGEIDGNKVPVKFYLPFVFKLDSKKTEETISLSSEDGSEQEVKVIKMKEGGFDEKDLPKDGVSEETIVTDDGKKIIKKEVRRTSKKVSSADATEEFKVEASKVAKNSPEHLRGKEFRAKLDKYNAGLK